MQAKKISDLIERAATAAGSQRKLAAMLDTTAPTLIQMKQGKRPANWRVRGKLRAILGESPEHAFMAAMAEDLEQSENADEKKAADGFKAMLAAFPDWRRRRIATLRANALEVARFLRDAVDRPLGDRFRNPKHCAGRSIAQNTFLVF